MALLKDIEIDDSGVVASYWRIYRADAVFPPAGGAAISVTFDGWVGPSARAESKSPVPRSQRTVVIEMENASDADEMSKALIYQAAKMQPMFSGAEDA
jgi:hypothetical protein